MDKDEEDDRLLEMELEIEAESEREVDEVPEDEALMDSDID